MHYLLKNRYSFLDKLLEQPDLQEDVYPYLFKPLIDLCELEQKIKIAERNSKQTNKLTNLKFEVEDLIDKRLPTIFEDFCNFPVEYRNKEKVNFYNGFSGTLKDLLLDNVKKNVQEIIGLQKKFYAENQIEFLRQSSYSSIKAQNFSEIKVKELTNKFDYDVFAQSFIKSLEKTVNQKNTKILPVVLNLNKEEALQSNEFKNSDFNIEHETNKIVEKQKNVKEIDMSWAILSVAGVPIFSLILICIWQYLFG